MDETVPFCPDRIGGIAICNVQSVMVGASLAGTPTSGSKPKREMIDRGVDWGQNRHHRDGAASGRVVVLFQNRESPTVQSTTDTESGCRRS